jgi:glycine/serine hydroxymethyltransferase
MHIWLAIRLVCDSTDDHLLMVSMKPQDGKGPNSSNCFNRIHIIRPLAFQLTIMYFLL